MIRVLDQVVADWGFFTWNYDGTPIEQVQVQLFNGITFIMDLEDFMLLANDEGF